MAKKLAPKKKAPAKGARPKSRRRKAGGGEDPIIIDDGGCTRIRQENTQNGNLDDLMDGSATIGKQLTTAKILYLDSDGEPSKQPITPPFVKIQVTTNTPSLLVTVLAKSTQFDLLPGVEIDDDPNDTNTGVTSYMCDDTASISNISTLDVHDTVLKSYPTPPGTTYTMLHLKF
jgi:hypothetical protein